jgi:hypothetical protein
MKKIFFITGLVLGVSLAVVTIGYVLSSQIEYVDLVGKIVTISEEDDALFIINDEEDVVFRYSIESWRGQVKEKWDSLFIEPIMAGDIKVTPDDFTRFTAVSPYPEGVKTIVFSTSTEGKGVDFSLFWTLNVGTRELRLLGDKNMGVVGNIVWSPKETHFAYILNIEEFTGEYLTVDNIDTRKKEFTISKDDVLAKLGIEDEGDFHPSFKSLRWREDGMRLFFTTNTKEEDVFAMWSVDPKGIDLRMEE